MKKNIVFVIPSIDAGGAEKSLVNLLNTIDYDCYIVDLVLFHKSGIFLSMIPGQVNILNLNEDFEVFSKNVLSSSLIFLRQFKTGLFLNRILFFLKNRFYKNKATAEQKAWVNHEKAIEILPKHYDAAIGFLEKSSIYFVIDKIKATHKIGWVHTNYSNSGMDADFDEKQFRKLDAIIAVSPECAADLKNNFPSLQSKIKVIYNIVSSSVICDLADENMTENPFSDSFNTILTIARLSPEKGCDLALEACRIMNEKGIDFKWIIIGDGPERTFLESKIKEYNLENKLLLIGLKQNPYPYLKQCTIYVQPSRYEGKSMAIEEAKILHKPIVVTNFATAADQIEKSKNGIIAKMNSESIALEIINLLNNKNLQQELSLRLSKEKLGTEEEITKLYHLIDA